MNSTSSQTTKQFEPKWTVALEWAILLGVIALATFLRYWKIGEVPPGFNSDEAVGAVGALTTLREGLQYSYEGQGGGGALGFYFAAAFFYIFGPSIETIRGLAAWAGVVSIFVNYWAVREMFRLEGLNRARSIAILSTVGLSVSLWHLAASRIAFAGIGVPFLMLPSVYFLWLGLNKHLRPSVPKEREAHLPSPLPLEGRANSMLSKWPFILSGMFLGSLLYIYLSGAFAPPLYAAFFLGQWIILWLISQLKRFKLTRLVKLTAPNPSTTYLTQQFWNIAITAVTAIIVILPIVLVLLTRPENEPGVERASQAFFMNPQINHGDPWGLLWRSFVGNFAAYGVSFSWLWGQTPRLVSFMPPALGLAVFIGFLIALIQALRGRAAYLFSWLWFVLLLFPSILAPDAIPHNLRTIGATTPAFIFAGLAIVSLYDLLGWLMGLLEVRLGAQLTNNRRLIKWGGGALVGLAILGLYSSINQPILDYYFFVYPETNDAKAAYHVYAVEMAEVINEENDSTIAFVLPRNTAAGEVFRNFTTDFLVALEEPVAGHYWVVDNEQTLADNLTEVAKNYQTVRVVKWKTSKHTGADPKTVIPYYLEKYGYYDYTRYYEYFDIDTYRLEVNQPDFNMTETVKPFEIPFGDPPIITMKGAAFGNASNANQVDQPSVSSNDLLWARLKWQLNAPHNEDLKSALLLYNQAGQLVAQADKLLQNNILQVKSSRWPISQDDTGEETTYFLMSIPPATPPGSYSLHVALYGEDSLERLALPPEHGGLDRLFKLGEVEVTPATAPISQDDLTLALPAQQELLPGLTLVGFETLPGDSVRAGQQVSASLIWQADEQAIPVDVGMSLWAKAGEGAETWPLSEPIGLAGNDYPTTQWQANELLRGWLNARVPPTLEPGEYKLQLRFSASNQANGMGTDSTADDLLTLPIGDFQVEGWARNFERPQPQLELEADFAGLATLIGLDVSASVLNQGEILNSQLYWQVDGEFDQDYTAFVHLIGPDGLLYGQVDQTPGAGAYPTTGWLTGEYISDGYTILTDINAPAGDYQIEIGLYSPTTGDRLPLNCNLEMCDSINNRVLLDGITIGE
ncbi:hypothetical protein QUF64_03055 [Anaerolineales bacterium HSG6]|nr:hypothetical protein [Anaerolineales bacterium HSG6]